MPNRAPLANRIAPREDESRIGGPIAIIILAMLTVGLFCSVAGISYAVIVTMKALGL